MGYIIKKLGVLIVTLLIISMLAFLAFQIIPGDPAVTALGTQATPERVEALREEWGLNRPLAVRYLEWAKGIFSWNWGVSYKYGMTVSEMLSGKLPITLALSAIAFLMVILISIPLSLVMARYEGRVFDRIISVINQVTMAIPPFFIGIIFTSVFGLLLKFFTPGAFVSFKENPGTFFMYLIFPALAIALPKSAMTIKLFRSSILGEMEKDYVRTAYSRGNSRAAALQFHVMRNAVIPVIAFLAATLSDIVAGSIIIEQVFSVPGIGQLLMKSIGNRDYMVVQAIVVIMAFLVVAVNFIADIAYQYIDPRIRLS